MLFMDPVWDSFPFYMRTVQSRTVTKITRVGSATDTRSDRSEFVFRPVPCKRMKRNVWRAIRTHTGPSSSRSHVITPFNWFPEGPDIKCFVLFLDFHFNSNKRITWAIIACFLNDGKHWVEIEKFHENLCTLFPNPVRNLVGSSRSSFECAK